MNSIAIRGLSLLLLSLALLSCGSGRGTAAAHDPEQGSPEWIIEMYFKRKAFPERERYMAGEMQHDDRGTVGSALSDSARVGYRKLQEDRARMVYAVNLTDRLYHTDAYCFFVRSDDGWKLNAIRSLALPGYVHHLLDQLESERNLSDKDAATLATMRLATSADDSLMKYFHAHAGEFVELRDIMRAAPNIVSVTSAGDIDPVMAAGSGNLSRAIDLLRGLHLSSIGRAGEGSDAFYITIYSATDNAVGYLSLPAGAEPPVMTPSRFIYMEEIIPGWYLYKTT